MFAIEHAGGPDYVSRPVVHELTRLLQRLEQPGAHPAVLATLVAVAGSSYRRPGARLLIDSRGHRTGTISGGCLEEDVRARAVRVAATGRAEVVTYDTTSENDLIWGVGLGCHGVVNVLLERLPTAPTWVEALRRNLRRRGPTELAVVWRSPNPTQWGTRLAAELPAAVATDSVFRQTVQPPPALLVVGAGDDAQPLVELAHRLGWHVTVADPRADFATRDRFPLADDVVVAPLPDLIDRCSPRASDAAVVMTHRYTHDIPVLRQLLARDLAYVGLLGPKKRAERILADLAADGFQPTLQARQRFHAPVGLDLGADTPAEVALSILAEIQATLTGRGGRSLRERTQPIHG